MLRNAVDQASPSLDKLNDKLKRNQETAKGSSDTLRNFTQDIADFTNSLNESDSRLSRGAQRLREFGNAARDTADRFRRTTETADEMFDRLRREGRPPKIGEGFAAFQSRASFVEQENRERALKRENDLVGQLGQAYHRIREGFSRDALQESRVLQEVAKGFKAARDAAAADPADVSTPEKIRLETHEALIASDELHKKTMAQRRAEFAEQKRLAAQRTVDEKVEANERIELAKRLEADEVARRKARIQELRRERDAMIATEFADLTATARYGGKKADKIKAAAEAKEQLLAQSAEIREAFDEEIRLEQDKINTLQGLRRSFAKRELDQAKLDSKERSDAIIKDETDTLNKLVAEHESARAKIRESGIARRGDLENEIRERDRRRFDFPELGGVSRGVAVVTAGFSDLVRGFRGAREGAREFSGTLLQAQRGITQFGARIGAAVSSVGQFVNIRWFFIVSLLSTLLSLAIQLGAALVALGASAVTAGAALGGALAAGAAQALPVVGLLAAAFAKLEASMKVVELRQKARDTAGEDAKARAQAQAAAADQLANAQQNLRNAIESVSDANEGIADAHQRVTDAMREQQEAVQNLADARKQAARAIIDAALDERDASLSLEEAELGVLDAKQRLAEFIRQQQRGAVDLEQAQAEVREAQERLRIARAEGDQAEIASAAQNLSFANQNVSAIQDRAAEARDNQRELEVAVERSELNVEQARIRRQRAAEEADRRRRQGVEGSPEVKAAQDRVRQANEAQQEAVEGVTDAERRKRDALENVAQANRNVERSTAAVAVANDKSSAAAKNAEREYNKLSAGQKAIVRSLEELQKTWNSPAITNIVDPMLLAISRGMDAINKLLKDPEILGAFRGLSETIAGIGDDFTRWMLSPEAKEFLLFFIKEAKANLPIIAKAAGDFGVALLNIARSASPVFRDLLERLGRWGEDLRNVTEDTGRLDSFFERAGEHLDQWLNLVEAVGRFLVALTGASADSGLKMLENITAQFDKWTVWIENNPEKVDKFFQDVIESLSTLLPMLFDFIRGMVAVLTSPEFGQFTAFVLEVVLPALVDLLRLLGLIARAFNAITEIPIVGPFIKLAAQLLILMGLFTKIFPMFKILTGFLNIRRFAVLTAIILLWQNWDKVRDSLERVWKWIDKVTERFGPLQGVMKLIIGALAGVGGGMGLIALFGLLGTRLGRVLIGSDRLSQGFGRLAGRLIGAGGLNALLKVGMVGAALAAGIALGNLLLKIGPLRRAMEALGEKAYDLASNLGLVNDPMEEFEGKKDPTGQMRDTIRKRYVALRKAGHSHAVARDTLFENFPNVAERDLRVYIDEFRQGGIDERRRYQTGGAVGSEGNKEGGDVVDRAVANHDKAQGAPVTVLAHVGEWILNKGQQLKLAQRLKTSVSELKMWLFGTEGKQPGGTGEEKPVGVEGGTKPKGNALEGPGYKLHPHTDPSGKDIWFIELNNGKWGQVTARAARRIISSQGQWIPKYVQRAGHAPGIKSFMSGGGGFMQAFANGGEVTFQGAGMQSFAAGGTVVRPATNGIVRRGNTVNQEFQIHTASPKVDVDYIMRVGAMHAEGAY